MDRRGSRPHLPGRSRFSGQVQYEQANGLVCAARGGRDYDPTGLRQNDRAGPSWGIACGSVNGQLFVNSTDAPPYGGTESVVGPVQQSIRLQLRRRCLSIYGQCQCALPAGNLHLCAARSEDYCGEPMEPHNSSVMTGWYLPLTRGARARICGAALQDNPAVVLTCPNST